MKNIYSSIDIGSDTIKLVVCELYKNKLNLLAASSIKAKGVKRGVIVDATSAANSIKEAFNEVESILGIKIRKVIANIPSYFAEFHLVKGEININHEEDNDMIIGDDISKLFRSIIEKNLKSGQEMVAILPIDFTIDDRESVKDPKGLLGRNLKTRAIVATTPRKNILSVVSLIESIGVEVVDVSITGIGDVYAFKSRQLDEQMGAIINFGHDTTSVSVYNKGIMVKNSIIGLGGQNIDNDISYIYKLNTKDATKVKEKLAYAHKMYANVNETLTVKNVLGDEIIINQYEASQIVMSRIIEILELAKKEVTSLTNHAPQYIIITGGITNSEYFNLSADEVFGKGTIVGNIKLLGIRNNKYVTALGNVLYFISKTRLKGKDYSMLSRDDVEDMSKPQKNNIISGDSMLGKVFGYFFNE